MGGAAAGQMGMAAFDAGLDVAVQTQGQMLAHKYAKDMYKHRYQWAVKDMRKAGINPILAAGGGKPPVGSGVGGGGSRTPSKFDVVRTAKEMKMMDNEIERSFNEAGRTGAQWVKESAQARLAMEQNRKTETERRLLEAQLPSAKAFERMDRTRFGEILRYIRRGRDAMTPWPGRNSR